MSDLYDITPEEHQGAIDWAHSIQARQAERSLGAIARDWSEQDSDTTHREELKRLAAEAGLNNEVIEQMFDRDKLEKVSEFDEPDVRRVSTEFVASLTKTMSEAGMSTGGRRLMTSSLPSGQVNALCATNSWDEKHYHIFIDPDLTVFCNTIGKIVAECLTHDNMVDGKISLGLTQIVSNVRSTEMQTRAADLFCSTVLHGTSRASKPWLPSAAALPLTLILTSALNMFPIAHELGHLHLGHLESDTTQQLGVEGLEDLVASVYSHEDEFQADAVGSIVTMQTIMRVGSLDIFTALAPYIFLKSVEILDACFEVFGERAGAMSFTHPSATERLQKVREVIAMHLRHHNFGETFLQAIHVIDLICHYMLFVAISNLNRLKGESKVPRERIRLRVAELGGSIKILGFFPQSKLKEE